MSQKAYEKILMDLDFQKLVKERAGFSWLLSSLILISYYSFILVIAFAPHWLGVPVSSESVITWGIPVGIFLIIFSMIMTAIYVLRCNGEYDNRMAEIVSRLNV